MTESEFEHWDSRYRAEGIRLREPSAFVVEVVAALDVEPGTAIDIAGGTGRNALWLAERGWRVTLVDISPTALELAKAEAAAAGVAIATQRVNLATADPEGGPWDLVVVAHYLNRDLISRAGELMTPGGHFVMTHPTVENLTRHERPPREHLLDPGELDALVRSAGLKVVHSFEGWTDQDRHEAQVVARRRA